MISAAGCAAAACSSPASAIPFVPTLIYLIASGAGPYLYESWVYYPLMKYPDRFALPFPAFYPLLPEHNVITLRDAVPALLSRAIPEPAVFDVWVKLVLYLPVLVYPLIVARLLWLAYQVHRRGRTELAQEGRALLAIAIAGALLLLQTWPRADLTHVLFGIQPTFVLFAYLDVLRLARDAAAARAANGGERGDAARDARPACAAALERLSAHRLGVCQLRVAASQRARAWRAGSADRSAADRCGHALRGGAHVAG